MTDRGTLEPGTKADVNVIDYDNLRVSHPEMIYDLPAGMPRLNVPHANFCDRV